MAVRRSSGANQREIAARVAAADRINHANIGLMAISCLGALFIPFELFLFSYAILGPAHYLTEISWLQKRKFFTQGKYDFWLLGALAVLGSFTVASDAHDATWTFLALGGALVFMLTGRTVPRILGLIPVIALAFLLVNSTGFIVMIFALFVPTLVHVYLFTGIFMIYGALKERSRSGYLAFFVFLLCPLTFWLVGPGGYTPATLAVHSYWKYFGALNLTLLGIGLPHGTVEARAALQQAVSSPAGITVMRFIAFAYTYHYLNWFSKTSVIKWHEMGRPRLLTIGTLWIGSIALYFYNFALGFKYLFFLSITHIYLEFPLNHLSIIGTFREVRSMMGISAPAGAGSRKTAA